MKKKAHSLKELYALALRLLARREHAIAELSKKLSLKTENPEWISLVIESLKEKKYLDDAHFAESYVRMRMNKGYGKLRIIGELKERGVAEEIIAKNFSEDDKKNQKESLKKIREKKFGKVLPKNLAEKAKQIRYLQYKGFSFDEIKMVLTHDEE